MHAEPMSLFAPLSPETRKLLDGIPALIDKTFPLPSRFRSSLPSDVAELSRLLTAGRGERNLSYLGKPAMLSAYLRYFLPWNLYRLCRLLPGLDIHLAANERITDLGCGPLTFASALWISRPDLRTVPLEFHCIDRSGPALDAGKEFFAALSGGNSPWKIHTIKGDIDNFKPRSTAATAARSFTEKEKNHRTRTPCSSVVNSSLVCAINVFNEMYGDISRSNANNIKRNAEKTARLLESHATKGGTTSDTASILVVEPGFPRCGEFISLLRGVFLKKGRLPISPCPHDKECPFTGKRWCHFAFETDDAPTALHRLSTLAKLPKERATLSFLFAGPKAAQTPTTAVRVISDAFPLPHDSFGRYCCSSQGLVLLAGKKIAIEKKPSGALVNTVISEKRDPKSDALLAKLDT